MSKLSLLEDQIRKCRNCRLFEGTNNAVPGEGNPDAEIMFIGEAPGKDEDLQGKPFVGAAGKFLAHLLEVALSGLKWLACLILISVFQILDFLLLDLGFQLVRLLECPF